MRLELLFNPRLLILLFMLLVLAQAMPAGGQDLVEVGSMPYGPCYAAALDSTREVAFLGNGSVLQAVETSNYWETPLLGELHLPGAVHHLFYGGDKLYVANGHGGLRIVSMQYETDLAGDLADVVSKVEFTEVGSLVEGEIGSAVTSLRDVKHLDIFNGYAYIANGRYGLAVVDVQDPTQPILLGSYPFAGEAQEVVVHPATKRAYVAAGANGLFIIDVSDPANMQEITHTLTVTDVASVALVGNYLYILDRTNGLCVVSEINTNTPVQHDYYDTGGDKVSVTVYNEGTLNGTAFVADGAIGLSLVDVSQPANLQPKPTALDGDYHLDTPGYASRVYAVSSLNNNQVTTLVADSNGGLRMMGKGGGVNGLWEMASYDTPGLACGIAISGEVAYIADGDGVRVYDISSPLAFPELGMVALDREFQGIAASGNKAYVTAPDGLHLVDATKLSAITTSPIYNFSIDNDIPARKVAVINDVLSVTGGATDTNPGLLMGIFSVLENPLNPRPMGYPEMPPEVGMNLAMDTKMVYVTGNDGLYALNYKALGSTELLPIFSLNSAVKVTVSEGYAYVTDADGLCVLDVADNVGAATARFVSRLPDPPSLTTVAVANSSVVDPANPDVAYSAVYAVGDNALHVCDVQRIKQDNDEETFTLTELAPLTLPLDKQGDVLAISGNRVYAIAGAAGVRIYGVDRFAPVANAGPDISIFSGFTAYLKAEASTDDVAIVKYNWKSLNSSIELSAADTEKARFITPKVSAPTTYEFELTVEDKAGRSSTDTVVVTVNPYTGRKDSGGGSSGCTMNPEAGFRIEWLFLAGLMVLLRLRRRKR